MWAAGLGSINFSLVSLEKISLSSCSATFGPRFAMKSVEQGGLCGAAGCWGGAGWAEWGEPAGEASAGDGITTPPAWDTIGAWVKAKGGWTLVCGSGGPPSAGG